MQNHNDSIQTTVVVREKNILKIFAKYMYTVHAYSYMKYVPLAWNGAI